jgi:hypothetical protein
VRTKTIIYPKSAANAPVSREGDSNRPFILRESRAIEGVDRLGPTVRLNFQRSRTVDLIGVRGVFALISRREDLKTESTDVILKCRFATLLFYDFHTSSP